MEVGIPHETKNEKGVFREGCITHVRTLGILPLHMRDTLGVGHVALRKGVFECTWVDCDLCMC